jgi:hypothetical protein
MVTMTQSSPDRTAMSMKPFTELSDSGLLWLINRVVFHPRGVALGLIADGHGSALGWELIPDPNGEPTTFPPGVDAEYYQRAEATLKAALDRT